MSEDTIKPTEKDQLPPYKGADTDMLIDDMLQLSSEMNRYFPDDSLVVDTAIGKILELETEICELNIILSEIDHELDDVEYIGGYVDGIRKLKAHLLAATNAVPKEVTKEQLDRLGVIVDRSIGA